MKLNQITEKQAKELDLLIEDQRKALAGLIIDMRTKKVSNVKEIASVKRTIARALTIKRQREIAELETATASQEQNEGESNG